MADLVVGIDLGTTNTVVAALGDGGATVLRDEAGEALIPSVVAIDDDGTLLVGRPALARLARHPGLGVRAFKRDMGTDRRFRLGNRELGATELSALVLREAVAVASRALGRLVERAVVTVPAYFQEPQRAATQEAARLAGLELVRMVNEPTAAAIAYGAADPTRERRIVVLDLGGGTFDVTLLDVFEGVIQVVGTAGNARLGGEDVTDLLLAWACAEAGLPEPDLDALLPVQALLRAECESAKRALATADAVRVALPGPDPHRWSAGPARLLTRAQFERLVAPTVDRALVLVNDALRRAEWTAENVDEVLLAGGATRMVALRRRVEERFGRAPVAGPDPDLVVALGAAIQAGLATHDSRAGDLVVTDVLAHSLGISTSRPGKDRRHDGYFLPVLHRNTTIPVRRVERVCTVHPQQTSVLVRVCQGDNRLVTDNRILGEFWVKDLPVGLGPGDTQDIDISFAHDLNGLLEVEATVVSTGKAASIVIEQHAGRLDEHQRKAALANLAALKVHPRELLPNRTLLEAAQTTYARLNAAQRSLLDPALFRFEDALSRVDTAEAAEAATALRHVLNHPALRVDGG